MSLTALEGQGVWVPATWAWATSIAGTGYVIDAAGELAALVLRCPRAGTLDRFDFNLVTVTNSPDAGLRASFQGVDAATGLPDGTVLGATSNAFVTYAHTVTTGWKSTNFGETVTVTRGQLIACVVDIPSFTASDSVGVGSVALSPSFALPYGVSATSTKQTSVVPIIVLHYTDGYACVSEHVPAASALTAVSYAVNTGTADEWGLGFQVPWPCTLNAVCVSMAASAGGDFEVLVYDSASNVLATLAHDADVNGGVGSPHRWMFYTASALTLTANTTYRVTIRPTTTTTLTLRYWSFPSAEVMQSMPGGDNFYLTSRLDQAGAWTDYNSGTFRQPLMALGLSAFDNAAQNVVTNVFSSPIVRPVEGE